MRKKEETERKKLREWRRRGEDGAEYRREKQEYRKLCKEKNKEENRRWEKKRKK